MATIGNIYKSGWHDVGMIVADLESSIILRNVLDFMCLDGKMTWVPPVSADLMASGLLGGDKNEQKTSSPEELSKKKRSLV